MLTPHRSAVSSRTYDQSQSLERRRVASHPNMASPFMLAPCPVGSLNHKDRFAGIPARLNLSAKCSNASQPATGGSVAQGTQERFAGDDPTRLGALARCASLRLDDAFLTQGRELLGAHAEPTAEDVIDVLTEQRRRHDLCRRTVEAHRPGWHLDLAGRGVVDGLHDAALRKGGIVHEFQRVEYSACWHASGTEQLHGLFFAVLSRPGGDDLVDLRTTLAACLLCVVARITTEVLATDDLEQALPVFGVGAAAEDIYVVVRPTRFAWVKRTGREAARS